MEDDPYGPSIIRYAVAVISAAISMALLYYFFRGSKSYPAGWQHASLTLGVVLAGVGLVLSTLIAVWSSECYARWTKPLPRKDSDPPRDEALDDIWPTSPETDHRS